MHVKRRLRRTGVVAVLILAFGLSGLPIGPGAGRAAAAADPAGTPFGNVEAAWVVTGGPEFEYAVQVKGWAIDPDTNGPIYVWVTVDGVGRHLYADVNRHDLAQAFPFGSRHGFSGRALVVDPGSHTVCVTASNVGPGVHKNLGCRSVTVSDIHAPIGNFDGAAQVAGGIEVTGWASDPDTAAPIYVWVTVDGVGRHLYADEDRRDVGRHGFRGTISASSTSGHTVCVTASNVSRGRHTNLGCKRVPPRVDAHSPFGMFEAAFHPGEYPFELVVRGWAIDPDTDAPIYVWVTINGVGRHLYANVSRPDVAAAFPTYGPDHGYVALLAFDGPESPDPRGPTVCVTASNVGAGTHTLLGCRILQW